MVIASIYARVRLWLAFVVESLSLTRMRAPPAPATRTSSELASLSRKVMNELRRSLSAKATPAWRLSTALTTSV